VGFNWDGDGYSLYDDSLIFMSNFDRVSALGEDDSFVKDLSLGGRDGSVSNAVWNSNGKYGGGFDFSGSSSSYISLGDYDEFSIGDGLGSGTPLTISAWINMNDATNFQVASKAQEWLFFSSWSDELVFYGEYIGGGFAGRSFDTSLTPYEGEWIHVAAVYTGVVSPDAFQLYLNGERVEDRYYSSGSPGDFDGGLNTASSVMIGRFANGAIDEVRMWNRSLSSDEIRQQYYSNLKKYDANDWNLYVNEKDLELGSYSYYAWLRDGVGSVFSTNERTLTQPIDDCVLISAEWSTTSVNWEEKVKLIVNGTNCERRIVDFAIYEDNNFGNGGSIDVQPDTAIIVNGGAVVNWDGAEWKDDSGTDPEYYFVASLDTNPGNSIQSSSYLNVNNFCNATCLSLRIGCGDQNICGVAQDCGECVARKTSWDPISGIPKPGFGIDETHMMYVGQTYDYENGPELYRIGTDGPYTHYIDKKHPKATNAHNIFGTPDSPRLSIPANLAPGSVVEIHNGDYTGVTQFIGSGNLTHPIFIRGIEGEEPVVVGKFGMEGSYYIIENIDFDRQNSGKEAIDFTLYDGSMRNIAIRHNEIHNFARIAWEGNQMIKMDHAHNNNNLIEDVVIFNNHIHHNGEGQGPRDIMSIWVGQNTENIWVIDNNIHHSGGDSIPIMSSSNDPNPLQPNHIYLGRNVMHDDYENAIDIKTGTDVIISQNKMYNFGPEYGYKSYGNAYTNHGPDNGSHPHQSENIWVIFNELFNLSTDWSGLSTFYNPGGVVPYPDEMYFIGNIVYDCHTSSGGFAGKSMAFDSIDQNRVYWINNLAYNCDTGGNFYGDRGGVSAFYVPNERTTVINNIFGKRHQDTTIGSNIFLTGTDESLNRMVISNNLFYDDGTPVRISLGSYIGGVSQGSTSYTMSEFMNLRPDLSQGFIEADPRHIDPDNGNFNLYSDSLARDNGMDASAYYNNFLSRYGIDIMVDFNGNPRVQGAGWDIGPIEYS
jgi:hypothetical protein